MVVYHSFSVSLKNEHRKKSTSGNCNAIGLVKVFKINLNNRTRILCKSSFLRLYFYFNLRCLNYVLNLRLLTIYF